MGRYFHLTSLHCALMVAEEGSFLGASRRVGIHYSALSRRIRDLELALGASLFERHPSGARPTPTGARFLRNLSRSLDDLDRTLAMVSAGKGEAGSLSIGFDTSLHNGELLDAVKDFLHSRTGVAVRFVETRRAELASALNERTIDLAIAPGQVRHNSGPSLQLWGSCLYVAVAADHPLAGRAAVEWMELRGHAVVTNTQPADAIGFATPGIAGGKLSIVHNDVSRETLLGLVREGMGIAVVPDNKPSANGMAFAKLCNQGHPVWIRYFARWRPEYPNPALFEFVAFLRKRYHAAS
jgi:DNA-binding transcriptional LysR family regulator